MARNLVRYVDQLPFFYAVGVIAMFVTRQHQRLGDLAAERCRERPGSDAPLGAMPARGPSRLSSSSGPMRSAYGDHSSRYGRCRLSAADLEVLEGSLRAGWT